MMKDSKEVCGELVDEKTLAERWNLDRSTVRRLLEEAGVPKYRLCKRPGGTVRYRPEDIEQFLRDSKEE